MATSRRKFLKAGMIFTVFARAPAILGNVVKDLETISATSNLTRETFARYLNTMFRIRLGKASEISLKLISVGDVKAATTHPEQVRGRENFSLLFEGPPQSFELTQETYAIEHQAMGRFSLFLVPVGKPENRHHEAIINR